MLDTCSHGPGTSNSVPDSTSSLQSAGNSDSASSDSSAVIASLASNIQDCSESVKRTRPGRHSLNNILGSLPKDISALIRSHSTSSRRRQHTKHHHKQDSNASNVDMVRDDDRPSRKLKSENRLYQFIARSLTRSRSRSRSRNGRDSPPPIDPNEPVPTHPPARNSRLQIDTMGQSSPSKPATRIPSRPLSSTTTATNTTITPSTPKAKKRPPSALPIPVTSSHIQPTNEYPRPTTPKASAARKTLHTLFGIPLSSPKKSSFNSSRHSSRRQSLEVLSSPPAYDDDEIDDDPTPKAFRPRSSRPYPHPESPTPDFHLKLNHDPSNSSTTNSSGSSRLQRFLTGPKIPPDEVLNSIRRPSSSSHHHQNSASSRSKSDALPSIPSPKRLKSPPRTPVAPDTTLPSKRPDIVPQAGASSSAGHSSRKSSAESGPSASTTENVGSVNGHSRIKTQGHGRSQRATKHGSFDFERPGWSASVMQRAGSGGTTGTGTSTGTSFNGWGRGHNGTSVIRDSAMGPGLAGVGTLQREASMKRAKEGEQMVNQMREEERRRRKADSQAAKEKMVGRDLGTLHENSQPSPRTLSPDEARAASRATGKSSSWGRKASALIGGGGKGKMTAIGLSHGLFDFEPPVPSPTRSTESVGAKHNQTLSVSWAGEKITDKSRSTGGASHDKLEKRKSREKEKRTQATHRGDRAPVPVPSASVGHKSGTRGRSLDLGLGLSWAPSSMKESALIPSSRLLGRSVSGASSSSGRSLRTHGERSASNPTSEHSRIEEENSLLGNHVAGIFKNALDDAGYTAFKRYVHLFDTHDIPFDGPTGIVARVKRLLMTAPALSEEGKQQLLDNFVRVVLQHA